MKRNLFFVTLAVIAIGLASCKGNKKEEQKVDTTIKPKMELSQQDTVRVRELATTFLEHLKNKEIDEAVGMLYYQTKDKEVVALPDTLKNQQTTVFKAFPVYAYSIDYIIFVSPRDSELKYTIEFFKKEPGDKRPNTISFFIRPVLVDGKWMLTMYDSAHDNAGTSEIRS